MRAGKDLLIDSESFQVKGLHYQELSRPPFPDGASRSNIHHSYICSAGYALQCNSN